MYLEIGLAVSGFATAGFVGTLSEYCVHRSMHIRLMLGKIYTDHHKEGWGQGWFKEFMDYIIPALPAIIGVPVVSALIPDGIWFGAAMGIGGFLFCMFSAYVHQLSHEYPELIFWMPQPVHTVHHTHQMWHHNFGMVTDFWDRVCGTYKRVDWKRERPIQWKRYFQIHWFSAADPLPVSKRINAAEPAH